MWQTDGRTDQIAMAKTAKAVAASMRKKCKMLKHDSYSVAMGQVPRFTERISSLEYFNKIWQLIKSFW